MNDEVPGARHLPFFRYLGTDLFFMRSTKPATKSGHRASEVLRLPHASNNMSHLKFNDTFRERVFDPFPTSFKFPTNIVPAMKHAISASFLSTPANILILVACRKCHACNVDQKVPNVLHLSL